MSQLNLPFAPGGEMRLSHFLGAENQPLLVFLRRLFTQKNSALVYFYGAPASGKTHLLQATARRALELGDDAVYADINDGFADLDFGGLAVKWWCLDNIEKLNGGGQRRLFDLYNHQNNEIFKLVLSSKFPISKLPFFADLKTRLATATIFRLGHLSDIEKKMVLKNKMRRRGINLKDDIYDYLLRHFSRDMHALVNFLNHLDEVSRRKKQKISLPFLKTLID